jgi:hypothetical protein
MGWTGRRPGIELQWRNGGEWDFDVRAGAFRASHTRGDRIGDEGFDNLRPGYGIDSQSYVGRFEVGRKRWALGVSGEWRPAEPVPGEGTKRFWAAGGDLALAPRKKTGSLSIFLEGYTGENWQDDNAFDGRSAYFVAARTLVARSFHVSGKARLQLEPYLRLSALDPDTSVADDLLGEATGGINIGALDHLRLNVEVQERRTSRNVPPALGLEPLGAAAPRERTLFLVQLGAGF